MKHDEIYEKHADHRKKAHAPKKRKLKESADRESRHQRVSFKNYVRELEEQFLEDELASDD